MKSDPVTQRISEYALQRRADKIAEVIKVYPDQVARGLAQREEASWLFGRLFLVGAITRQQKDVAEELARVTRRYLRVLNKYSNLSSVQLESVSGSRAVENLTPEAQKACLRLEKRYNEMYSKLDKCGEDVRYAVELALREEQLVDLGLVIKGLDALRR